MTAKDQSFTRYDEIDHKCEAVTRQFERLEEEAKGAGGDA